MLDAIYQALKTAFMARKDAMVGTSAMPRYDAPDELLEENVDAVIKETNDTVADAASNNTPDEIIAASRKGNLLLSLARDNHSAQRTRLQQVRSYLIYVDRALYEADAEDTSDSDGLLLAGIRRVDL